MYSDELEKSLDEEIIKIMMEEDERGLVTIAPPPPLQPPIVNDDLRKTPSPCHSPIIFMHPNSAIIEMNGGKPRSLSPMVCMKDQMYTRVQQQCDYQTSKPVAFNATNFSSSKASGISIKIEEDSKETKGNKMRDEMKRPSTLSPEEVTSFQKRLFGLQKIPQNRKSHTLPLTSKSTISKKMNDVQSLTKPVPSPTTIIDAHRPIPPPEPAELKYIEVINIRYK